jgi:hypothetical protein
MKTGWRFPLSDNGPEDGLNHPGIETFLKSPIESLAREIIQNSRDAAKDSGTQVRVDFELWELPKEQFPGIKEYTKLLDQCQSYWKESVKTVKFFEKARAIAASEFIPVLKVSDYNTKGLRGSYEKRGTDWHKLTKSVGASDKGGGQDGSFGIGKHAPFACSGLRTVFYGTKDVDGNLAFQGVCKLVSHLNDDDEPTQGTGYFGNVSNLGPIHDLSKLEPMFGRNAHGTDLFIAGFDYAEDWEERIVRSVLENFFVAIHGGDLVVYVHGTRIDHSSLSELMHQYFSDDSRSATLQFYEAFTNEKSYFVTEEDFRGLGRIDLHIAIGKHFSKQVAMFRRSGMLVYRKKGIRTPLRFAGVFVAKGEQLNLLLKSLEPPSHDEWQAARHEDRKYAASVLRELNLWISEKINEISPTDDSEHIDPEGVSNYLPDERDTGEQKDQPDDTEDGDAVPKPVELVSRVAPPLALQQSTGVESDEDGDGFESDVESSDDSDSEEGQVPAAQSDGGGDDNGGDAVSGDDAGGPRGLGARVNLTTSRMFCTDASKGAYRLICVPEVSGTGHLSIDIVGEVGREPATVLSASVPASKNEIKITHNGKIGPLKFEAGSRIVLSVLMSKQLRCALEVVAYAD